MNSNWVDVENMLERIRLNCNYLSEYHRKRFYVYKQYEKWFQLPLIVLSAINSVLAVSLSSYTSQSTTSLVNCLISLICGIISSIKLFLTIEDNLKMELEQSKSYYTLSISIIKTLHLPAQLRSGNGKEYLENCFTEYKQLCEQSKLLKKKYKSDHLIFEKEEDCDKDYTNEYMARK